MSDETPKQTNVYMLQQVYNYSDTNVEMFSDSLIGFYSTYEKAYKSMVEDLKKELQDILIEEREASKLDNYYKPVPVTENGELDMNAVITLLGTQQTFYCNIRYTYRHITYQISERSKDIVTVY